MTTRRLLVLSLTAAAQIVLDCRAVTAAEAQEVRVQVSGPVALVSVTRTLLPSEHALRSRAHLAVFDVALPEQATGFAAEILQAGRQSRFWRPLAAEVLANDDTLALARKAPADPDARYRLVWKGLPEHEPVQLRYSFALPLHCKDGHWMLSFPGAVDLAPVSSDVHVETRMPAGVHVVGIDVSGEASPGGDAARQRKRVVGGRGRAPAHAAWDIRLRVEGQSHADGIGDSTAMAVRFAASNGDPGGWWGLCRAVSARETGWPQTVIVVADVSRSVGVVGLALEREFLAAFLESLPAGTRWNAVLFNRTARPLFPVFRLVTGESLSRLEEAMSPGALQNGTAPAAAIRMAADLLRRELREGRGQSSSPSSADAEPQQEAAWLLAISDGSLPDDAPLRLLENNKGAPWSAAGVILLRPEGDAHPAAAPRQAFEALAKRRAGVFRVVNPHGIADVARKLPADLLQGGDWFQVQGEPGKQGLPQSVPPGSGTGGFISRRGAGPLRIQMMAAGQKRHRALPYVKAAIAWPRPQPAQVMAGVLPSGAQVFLLPLPKDIENEEAGGELERSVLKNALALAFLPRARACYLSRNAKTAEDRDLAGRVRLSLQLERGEVLAAHILASTLHHPTIETCLSEAAFALNIPRPTRSDAPVEAILNLVFRPLTTPEADRTTGSADEIEVLLGPQRQPQSPDFDLRLLDDAARSP